MAAPTMSRVFPATMDAICHTCGRMFGQHFGPVVDNTQWACDPINVDATMASGVYRPTTDRRWRSAPPPLSLADLEARAQRAWDAL